MSAASLLFWTNLPSMLRFFFLVLLACSIPLFAAEHWIKVTTPHFEMYTTNGEKQAVAALQQFEEVRYFFLQSSPSKKAPDVVVRIVAFRNEKEYRPYQLNGGAFAYYLKSRKVDYIVMQDISPEHYQTAAHEYTHLIVQNQGLKLPVWLNEGIADVYSSLEARGDQAIVGRPLEGRGEVLRTERWLDLNTLFAVDERSPYYNESDKMSIFYAESWGLTHMLSLGDAYRANFSKFLSAILAGQSSADALQRVYGKSVPEVFHDLQAYARQSSVKGAIYNVKLKAAEMDPQVSDASDLGLQLALADLLASRTNSVAEAETRLNRLAQQYPGSVDVAESLGYLEWEKGDKTAACRWFGKAFSEGSTNAEMMFQYAGLLQEAQTAPEQIIPVLLKASILKPGNLDIWFNLGMLQMQSKVWLEAARSFSHITTVPEERAFALFSAEAFCYVQLKDFKDARDKANVARQYARTPEQSAQSAQMLQFLDAVNRYPAASQNVAVEQDAGRQTATATTHATQPAEDVHEPMRREVPRDQPAVHWADDVKHVEGVAKTLACDGKVPRLHLVVEGREMVFELANPDNIVVRNIRGGHFDFHCGAQKDMKLGVFYSPVANLSKIDGAVRELVF